MVEIFALLAQAAPATGDSLSNLMTVLNLGLAGVGLLAFVRGWIVPGKTHQDALDRAAKAEKEVKDLNVNLNNNILPELQRSRSMQQGLGQLIERVIEWVEREENRSTDR